jgi:hypothetical protein
MGIIFLRQRRRPRLESLIVSVPVRPPVILGTAAPTTFFNFFQHQTVKASFIYHQICLPGVGVLTLQQALRKHDY